jgi:catechol 2,3-dioxygenase-like lactoylglutathione lyase family enzyme
MIGRPVFEPRTALDFARAIEIPLTNRYAFHSKDCHEIRSKGWGSMQNRKLSIAFLAALVLAACITQSPSIASKPDSQTATLAAEHGHFHHVHLNVSDVAKTAAFYEHVFGVVPVQYGARAPALMAERAFIFLSQAKTPIASQLQTGVIHIGWSGIDGPSEFAWWQKEGIEFYTPLTKFLTGHFMYLYGPDREVIEIWTVEKHRRFNHVHMLSADPKATAEWFARVTNSELPAEAGAGLPGYWKVDFGDVALDILPDTALFKPKERTGAIQPTDGAGIDHIAFSFASLDAALRRVTAAGIPIVRPIATDATYGVRSFFVRSPEGVLVELVEARPLPNAAWQ